MKKCILGTVVICFFVQMTFTRQVQASKGFWGSLLTIVGIGLAVDGFSQVEKEKEISYTWTEQTVDKEWDFETEWVITQDNVPVDSASYTDPDSSSIAYEWSYYEYVYNSNISVLLCTIFYLNHHITYKTVTHNGTTTIKYKEPKNINVGIAGTVCTSVGIYLVLDSLKQIDSFSKFMKKHNLNVKVINKGYLNLLLTKKI